MRPPRIGPISEEDLIPSDGERGEGSDVVRGWGCDGVRL